MSKRYNALIIGAGKIGAFFDSPKDKERVLTHAHAYKKHSGFNLIGFYDQDRRRSDKAARIWGGKSYKSLTDAFSENPIDVVTISTPDDTHFSMLKEIVKYKPKVVFAEKPLTTDIDKAKEIVEIYSRFNIPIVVNYNRRFVPEIIKIKEDYEKGVYGKFEGGMCYYGKGILHNGSHLINLLRFIFNEVNINTIIESEVDYNSSDPSVSVMLNVAGKKFLMRHLNSKLYTISEVDLLFQNSRLRLLDSSGNLIEKYEIKENKIFKGYKNIVKTTDIKTSLGTSIYSAIENIFLYLEDGKSLSSTAEDTIKDLDLCNEISKVSRSKKRILIFSHDTGGANMVFPLVKPLKDRGYDVLLYGKDLALKKYTEFKIPAINITHSVLQLDFKNIRKFIEELSPNFVITGTSGDMTEKYIWKATSQLNIVSFALLDSWINSSVRFPLDSGKKRYLPTKICVIDNRSKEKVRINGIDKNILLARGNPYFEFLIDKNQISIEKNIYRNAKLNVKKDITVLYISEPISTIYKKYFNSDNYLGYNEKTILKNILNALSKISKNKTITIKIKQHPQESSQNYVELLKRIKTPPNVSIKLVDNSKFSNWELINSSDIVCGMGSTMLSEAYILRKPTISIGIGIKKNEQTILNSIGKLKTVLTQDELNHMFFDIIENGKIPRYNYVRIENSIQKIVSDMEKILWQS